MAEGRTIYATVGSRLIKCVEGGILTERDPGIATIHDPEAVSEMMQAANIADPLLEVVFELIRAGTAPESVRGAAYEMCCLKAKECLMKHGVLTPAINPGDHVIITCETTPEFGRVGFASDWNYPGAPKL